PDPVPAAPYVPPTNKDLEILFLPMFEEYLETPCVERPGFPALAVPVPVNTVDTPSSTTIDQDAPCPSHSPSSLAFQSPSLLQGVAAESNIMEVNPFTPVDNDPFINVFALKPSSEASSSGDVSSAASTYVTHTHHYLRKYSKDHSLDNVIDNPSRLVSTRKQLAIDTLCKNMIIYQMDVNTTFVNGELKKEVYAPRAWYDTLSQFLLSNKFSNGAIDLTLFTPKTGKHILLVQIYMQTMQAVRTHEEARLEVLSSLGIN
nr:hypothetical protein [Tanacetum cinerariifolium]